MMEVIGNKAGRKTGSVILSPLLHCYHIIFYYCKHPVFLLWSYPCSPGKPAEGRQRTTIIAKMKAGKMERLPGNMV
jgi:hypothetical protein